MLGADDQFKSSSEADQLHATTLISVVLINSLEVDQLSKGHADSERNKRAMALYTCAASTRAIKV